MTIFSDTIAAISTAPGTGAIAVVRLSGDRAWKIAGSLFTGSSQKDSIPTEAKSAPRVVIRLDHAHNWRSNFASHGFIFDPERQEIIDEVVVTPFKAPHTYTGEDLIEISCHGGPVVTNEILALLLKNGARLARRGEFTERAFVNGKLDLTQAEAVLDVIQAKTMRQGRRALSALTGSLGERIKTVREDLMVIMARIVAGLDFPEEIGDAPEPEVEKIVVTAYERLQELSKTARSGRYLRDGLKIAIVGRPNAGKSSLLNQLLKFERAIVTDIPGTTRDSLEELLDLNGVPVILIDTAGIRPTDDHVEKIGIERTIKAISESDLVLFLFDLTAGWSRPEEEIRAMLDGKPFILIRNKVDAAGDVQVQADGRPLSGNLNTAVDISAKTGQNIPSLTQAIEAFVFSDEQTREGPSLNARQAQLCLKAAEALQHLLLSLQEGMPQDCLATDLKTAVDALSEISGDSVTEEVITQVFATFCIGK